MRLCIKAAALSDQDVPVGAVVVKNGQVLATASNRREQDGAPFHHAEMLAMQEAAHKLGTRRLSGCTLYVSLEPCPMCAGALIMAAIDRVVFGAFDHQYGCCGSLYALPLDARFNHRVEVTGGVLEDEAGAQLEAFFKARRGQRTAHPIVPASMAGGKQTLDESGCCG